MVLNGGGSYRLDVIVRHDCVEIQDQYMQRQEDLRWQVALSLVGFCGKASWVRQSGPSKPGGSGSVDHLQVVASERNWQPS